jgi:DNA-binding transcriptional ArsR family regulator
MVQQAQLDSVFHALADPTRRAMVQALVGGERRVGDLAAPFDMSFAAASKHVRVLEAADLVRRRVEGRNHLLSLRPETLRQAQDWLSFYETLWTDKFAALDALLSSPTKEE